MIKVSFDKLRMTNDRLGMTSTDLKCDVHRGVKFPILIKFSSMIPYQTKTKKISGTSYSEVRKEAAKSILCPVSRLGLWSQGCNML
ncbi:MAG: hypothetical protein P1P85_05020 [Patescibacteria group bacterium]|nr:hypothetical protein [Patescibacteria group bacterium]